MRCAYFDCFSGAAGDMILAAMLDAGLPLDTLEQGVARLGLPGVTLVTERVKRHGIAATHVRVEVAPASQKKHRHLGEILRIISGAGLSRRVTHQATTIFERLAAAEAAVHGTTVEKVHFHEVGAADAIVDIVGACIGLEAFEIDHLMTSPIPTGSGTLTCEHGVMPVPAPATAKLLEGAILAPCEETGELTTPTGAAILTTLMRAQGGLPAMRVEASGFGAGTREGVTRPNLLRLIIGELETADGDEQDTIIQLDAQLDDAPGQVLAHAMERLLEAGALDVTLTPIWMKKGRPGQLLTVLVAPGKADELEAIIFRETSTFGVRRHEARRSKLARAHESVETRFGPVRVKVGRRAGQVVQATPEYEDCAAAAERHGAALKDVQREALQNWANLNA